MKRLTLIVLCLVLLSWAAIASAATIRNNLNQSVVLNLANGSTVNLPAKGTAVLSDADLASPALQRLINAGDIAIVPAAKSDPDKKKKDAPKKPDKKKKKD